MAPALNGLKILGSAPKVRGFFSTARKGSSKCGAYQSYKLDERVAVEVKGEEGGNFLQGLMTNDIHHLDGGVLSDRNVMLRRSLYSMFLDTKGRVNCEAIVYAADEGRYLLDVDKDLSHKMVKQLKLYKLRKRIDIRVREDLEPWVVFRASDDPRIPEIHPECDQKSIAQDFKDLEFLQDPRCCYCTVDPRVKALGFRILAHVENPSFCYQLRELDGTQEYSSLRYRLGVPEGKEEIPPGKALPLEYNADYLHGVSFHKGCYVGQELTARTHHTGVIRKRVMPLKFIEKLQRPLPHPESVFIDENDKPVGKLIKCDKYQGIGLMRIQECLDAEEIRIKVQPEIKVKVEKPFWWPKISPKKQELQPQP